MDHPVMIARRKVAARLEAEIIGLLPLPSPYRAAPKSRVERAIGSYLRGVISRKQLRERLSAIAAEMRQ